jgi:dihydroorotate dehydrogenase electron transfer subunit
VAAGLPAELLDTTEILPGRFLQRFGTADIVGTARAGQYVHLLEAPPFGLPRRRPLPLAAVDRAAGSISLPVPSGPPGAWQARLRPGDQVLLDGPLGRPFEVDPRARHVLLVGEGDHVAPLLALAVECLAAGRRVALLIGAERAAGVFPSRLLPDEVEYAVATLDGSLGQAGDVLGLVPAYEAWADQAFAAGSWRVLRRLVALARGRDGRLGVARLGRKAGRSGPPAGPRPGSVAARRKSWLQIALPPAMGCALGTCLGCVVPGSAGPTRPCREGPCFAVDEIDWGEAG